MRKLKKFNTDNIEREAHIFQALSVENQIIEGYLVKGLYIGCRKYFLAENLDSGAKIFEIVYDTLKQIK